MADSHTAIAFSLRFAPKPGVMSGMRTFEKSLKGGAQRISEGNEYPIVIKDTRSNLELITEPERFCVRSDPLDLIERFGPSASSLAAQFLRLVRNLSPREVELSVQLSIPVPNPSAGTLGGYTQAAFTWPRKLELRPEALGKDHFLPTETGIVHLRLSTHVDSSRSALKLLVANRHDRVSEDAEHMEQAYALCLKGVKSVVDGIITPAYRRALSAVVPLAPAGNQNAQKLQQAYGMQRPNQRS